MPATMTYAGLCQAMQTRTPVAIALPNGGMVCGCIQAIEMEDGSGKCFNVRICDRAGNRNMVFVRTS